jgi:hypothetical protein
MNPPSFISIAPPLHAMFQYILVENRSILQSEQRITPPLAAALFSKRENASLKTVP